MVEKEPVPVVEVEDSDLEQEEEEEEESWDEQRRLLLERAAAANLQAEEARFEEGNRPFLRLHLPAGRDTRPVLVFSAAQADALIRTDFEQYVFLQPYQAICSYRRAEMEALLRFPAAGFFQLSEQLLGEDDGVVGDDGQPTAGRFVLRNERRIEISLGPASETLKALAGRRSRRMVSLQVAGFAAQRGHDEAVHIMEQISNSLFFQIDLAAGIVLNLARDTRRLPGSRFRRGGNLREEIQFPASEYDSAPISLYWYARSARGLPLLQFLAFYQAIEFYFPVYSAAEARRRVRTLIKDPTFRADRDSDLGRLVAVIQAGRSGALGDERSQLRATVHECVGADELRRFIEVDRERSTFLSSKGKSLTNRRILVANTSADLRNDVADRIYDIRCKIVHTKYDGSAGGVDLLLPFSKEADQLQFDIELVEYVAQRVLIAASSPLSMQAARRDEETPSVARARRRAGSEAPDRRKPDRVPNESHD